MYRALWPKKVTSSLLRLLPQWEMYLTGICSVPYCSDIHQNGIARLSAAANEASQNEHANRQEIVMAMKLPRVADSNPVEES